jgi:hypothetical protein
VAGLEGLDHAARCSGGSTVRDSPVSKTIDGIDGFITPAFLAGRS